MARERGVLISESEILTTKGRRVRTFIDCDEGYLEMCGVEPGDFITFGRGTGTTDAINFRKTTPTPQELATFAKVLKKYGKAPAKAASKKPPKKTSKKTTKKATKKAAPVKGAARKPSPAARRAAAKQGAAKRAAAKLAAAKRAAANRVASAKRRAAAKKRAEQRDAALLATVDTTVLARIRDLLRPLVKQRLVKTTATAEKTALAILKREPIDTDNLVVRVLEANKCPRLASYPEELHYSVAGMIDEALAELPVRVRNNLASMSGAVEVSFHAGDNELERSWFNGASQQIVAKLDAYLAAHNSPRRVHRMPSTAEGMETILLATPDDITAVQA